MESEQNFACCLSTNPAVSKESPEVGLVLHSVLGLLRKREDPSHPLLCMSNNFCCILCSALFEEEIWGLVYNLLFANYNVVYTFNNVIISQRLLELQIFLSHI